MNKNNYNNLILGLFIISLFLVLTTQNQNVIYFPLDERFATRGIFLNMAKIIEQDFKILTPSLDDICHYRTPANIPYLQKWLNDTLISNCKGMSEIPCILIISSELFLYGGLINSRISEDKYKNIILGLEQLQNLKKQYNDTIKIYISNVIMRIPDYSLNFEEPTYYSEYGKEIFEWSYYTDKFEKTLDILSYLKALKYKSRIPKKIRDDWIQRRQRNNQVQ